MEGKKVKRERVVKSEYSNGVLKFEVIGAGEFEFHLDDRVSIENRMRAPVYGWSQRFPDFVSGLKTPQEKLAGMIRLRDHLESGSPEWTPPRIEVGYDVGIVIQAMIRLGLRRTPEGCEAGFLHLAEKAGKGDDPNAREIGARVMADAKDVASEILKIKQERSAAALTVMAADLLEGLGDEEDE